MTYHIIKNIGDETYKPSDGFVNFCKENEDVVIDEIKKLYSEGIPDTNEIKLKLKTYKNRYYIISKNMRGTKIENE